MATFRVGQRVRLARVRDECLSKYIGDTGTFSGYEMAPAWFPRCDCRVLWDDGMKGCEESECLEPIQPERNRVVAWEDCPWQPNREFVS